MRALTPAAAFTRFTRWDVLALLLVLLAAAILRLGEPDMLEFLHDEAMLSLMAQDMAAGQGIPLTGIPSSAGVPNPPISVYIMAIPYALSPSPQIATLFVAALNVAGVGLLWLIARRWLGQTVALAAGLAYALNPWAVLYSRKIWAQDFHTPFVLLALLLGLYGFGENKRWAQIACLPVLLIALQIHFAAWALLPLYLCFLWLGRKNLRWPALAISAILAALALMPFLAGLSDTLARDPQRLDAALNRQGGALSLSPQALVYTARLAAGVALETWTAPETMPAAPTLNPLGLLALAAAFGIVPLLAQPQRRPLAPLILAWVGLPLLVFSFTWTPVYPHYFIASIPALCLLIALAAAGLIERLSSRPAAQAVIAGLFALALLGQGASWRALLRTLDTTYTPRGFGTPMRYLNPVRDALADFDDVVVISDGFEILHDQEAAVWPVMLRGSARCVRTLSGDGAAVFPAGRFAALTAFNAPENALGGLYFTPDAQVFPLRPGEGVYRLSAFEMPPAWDGPALIVIEPARFGSGIELTGYHLDTRRLYLEWRLPGPVKADYHYFGHFLDAAGERLGQRDHILWPGRFWCAGDRLITWADTDLPPGTVTLRVGLYTLENGGFVNTPVLDEGGSPVGVWVDITLDTALTAG